jgi:serine/threonine-protein kinase RsbW
MGKIPAGLDQLAGARSLIEEVASQAGLDDERSYNLKVAVSEACANAIEHSSSGERISLCAWLQPDRLVVEILHSGEFRLSRDQGRTHHRGLGLPLMVALMDEVKIGRPPSGGTSVSLSLFLPVQ